MHALYAWVYRGGAKLQQTSASLGLARVIRASSKCRIVLLSPRAHPGQTKQVSEPEGGQTWAWGGGLELIRGIRADFMCYLTLPVGSVRSCLCGVSRAVWTGRLRLCVGVCFGGRGGCQKQLIRRWPRVNWALGCLSGLILTSHFYWSVHSSPDLSTHLMEIMAPLDYNKNYNICRCFHSCISHIYKLSVLKLVFVLTNVSEPLHPYYITWVNQYCNESENDPSNAMTFALTPSRPTWWTYKISLGLILSRHHQNSKRGKYI